MFKILNTYTHSYLTSGRDMATASNMVVFPTQEAAEFAILELQLTYPNCANAWSVEAC